MYCKYCGKVLKSDIPICTDCQTAIKGPEKKKSSLPFYLILILGFIVPMCFGWFVNINTLISVSDDYQTYNNLIQSYIMNFLYTLPSNPLFLIIVALVLKKTNKIDLYCYSKEDAILWIGARWMLLIFPVERIVIAAIRTISSSVLVGYSMYANMQAIFEMPGLWYNVCFVMFVLIRNKKIVLSKKKISVLSAILLAWSGLLVMLESPLLHLFKMPPEYFHIAKEMWFFSPVFMWLRYLILLFFAVLLARKQIGYASGVICMVSFFLLPEMLKLVLIECNVLYMLGATESVGYVLSLIVLFASIHINERLENI